MAEENQAEKELSANLETGSSATVNTDVGADNPNPNDAPAAGADTSDNAASSVSSTDAPKEEETASPKSDAASTAETQTSTSSTSTANDAATTTETAPAPTDKSPDVFIDGEPKASDNAPVEAPATIILGNGELNKTAAKVEVHHSLKADFVQFIHKLLTEASQTIERLELVAEKKAHELAALIEAKV